MCTVKRSVSTWPWLLLVTALAGLLLGTSVKTVAQNQGWNGVYLGIGTTNTNPAFAFVDAVPYLTDIRCATGGCSICDTIALAFKDYQSIPKGLVIDARGITGSALVCLSDMMGKRYPNPWSVFPSNRGDTVLLPVGTIYLETTWILTNYTRVVGEGPGLTTIQPCTTTFCSGQAFSGTDLIDMGNSSICPMQNGAADCQGIVIQHLGLNGGNLSGKNGIVNSASQERSSVDDVWLLNMGTSGTGVSVTGPSSHSGPYSKIYYSGNGTCASISASQTRGVRGLTCVMTGSSAAAAVFLDARNNTLEDVYISGFSTSQDGILVGANASASNSVLFNINGNTLGSVVHISNAQSTSSVCPVFSDTPYNACDVTVLGVTASSSTNSIRDDLTSPATQITDANLGMYVVGEPVQGTRSAGTVIYSRFTTSRSAPTWLVGINNPLGDSCATGSLYSLTSGTSGTLFGCQGTGSASGSWHKIN